jgi:N-acetylglucosamine-6-phosphate deacetylase
MSRIAYTGARIFDGETWWDRSALIVADDRIEGIVAADSPTDAERVPLGGGVLAPGFIDLQVNGGGGVLFNDQPDVAAIRRICETHARFGTAACLPTLISDTREKNAIALAAGIEAARMKIPGFLGLHLEGPHLDPARKGAHDGAMIRRMDESDLVALLEARAALPSLLVTVAPEAVTSNQITRLVEAGIVVSLGHSGASYELAAAAADAGARVVTHLFNAQSQIGPREPGLVGVALDRGDLYCGLIADGVHVHPANVALALRAKRGPGRIFLVTDAVSIVGTDATVFTLGGREVRRQDGALRLADGTLAGADLTMIDAVTYTHRTIGVPLEEALRMASLYPAEALGVAGERGRIARGYRADLVHMSEDLAVRGTLAGGATAWTDQ